MTPDKLKQYINCPCCGDDGAESDDNGLFYEGQPLLCACNGNVVIDEGEGYADIMTWDCGCQDG